MSLRTLITDLIDRVEAAYPTVTGWDLFQMRPGQGAFKIIRASGTAGQAGSRTTVRTVSCDLAVSIPVNTADPLDAQIGAAEFAESLELLVRRYLEQCSDAYAQDEEIPTLSGVLQQKGSERDWFAYAEVFFDITYKV
jgi:hypothetical protein